jgi:RNA polymerase sigma-70 factor (ECF subfamily)
VISGILKTAVSWTARAGNAKRQMNERDLLQAFHDHKDAVYGFALRMTGSPVTAEDLAQDCFLELLRHPHRFDPTRGSVRAFLIGITRNLAFKRWRAEKILDSLGENIEGEDPDLTAGPVAKIIASAVQSLSPLQREALVLFEYEGFTLEEIASLVNADVGTVKSRLHRARERLRHLLMHLRNGSGGG